MNAPTQGPLFRLTGRIERLLIWTIVIMMILVTLLSTIDLGALLLRDILSPPVGLLAVQELLDLFGAFLIVLIGFELLHSVKHYLSSEQIRADLVILVALIAVTRKVIVTDWAQAQWPVVLSFGVLVIGLAGSYYLVRRAAPRTGADRNSP